MSVLQGFFGCRVRRRAGPACPARPGLLASSAALCALLAASAHGVAATATAQLSSLGIGTPTASGTLWTFSVPKPTDVITWSSGDNSVDGALVRARGPVRVESKFTPFVPPTGRAFVGYSLTDGPGTAGSTTLTDGSGGSRVVPGATRYVLIPFFGGPISINFGTATAYAAAWTVNATGTLGPGAAPSWSSRSDGIDPLTLTRADFSQVSQPAYDLFFAAELSAGSFSPAGSLLFDVGYQTAAGSTSLLSASLDAAGARVISGAGDALSLFRLSDLLGDAVTGTQVSALDIQGLLQSDVQADGALDSALALGFLLKGLPVPSVDLGDGVVARVSVGIAARDAAAAAVPQPGTLVLLALGGLMLAGSCGRSMTKRSLG